MAKNKKDIEEKNSVPVTIKMLLDQYTEILRKIFGRKSANQSEFESLTSIYIGKYKAKRKTKV